MVPMEKYMPTSNGPYNVAPHESIVDEAQVTRRTSMRDVVESVNKVQAETLAILNRLIQFIHPQPINDVPDQDNHCLAEAVDGLLNNADQILARVHILSDTIGM